MRNVWEVGGSLEYCSGLGEILQLYLFCDSIRIFFLYRRDVGGMPRPAEWHRLRKYSEPIRSMLEGITSPNEFWFSFPRGEESC